MTFDEETYRDKVHGCWLGKSIGGTIGGPHEGRTEFLNLPFEYPAEAIDNDDLDLQLVWLKVLREDGVLVGSGELAEAWLAHIIYPMDEYGVALANLRMGLRPPASGFYNNWFKDAMGAPIRSEIWACAFAGKPATASWYAQQDAQVDHWGEGVYGEIFFAALESMAFAQDDLPTLVAQALEFIPSGSRVHRAVTLATKSFREGVALEDARNQVLAHFGHHNFTDAPQNIAFTILGLLHGEGDLLKSIVLASNCGYDVDCTAATAGAVAGILAGGKAIQAAAAVELDQRVMAGPGIRGCELPATLRELTAQAVETHRTAILETDLPELPRPYRLTRVPHFEPPMRIPCHFDQVPEDSGEEQPLLTETAEVVVFEGAFFDVEDLLSEPDAMLVLETCIDLDRPRQVVFNPHCTGPVALWVDNRKVLEWRDSAPFLPGGHRGPKGRNRCNRKALELESGIHEITIRIHRPDQGQRLEFAWVATDEAKHWLTDVTYVLKP
jgi:ADP-ribosylglycohydrolase